MYIMQKVRVRLLSCEHGENTLTWRFALKESKRRLVLDRGFNGGEGVCDMTRSFAHKPFRLRRMSTVCTVPCATPVSTVACVG